RRADVEQATRDMLARLGLGERARVEIGGELGELLARMGATIERRERDTHYDAQPLQDSIWYNANGVALVGQHVGPDGLNAEMSKITSTLACAEHAGASAIAAAMLPDGSKRIWRAPFPASRR
ncbi:hypothetical protein LTR94_028874, partial [Friedmanniomyces endolithicus]